MSECVQFLVPAGETRPRPIGGGNRAANTNCIAQRSTPAQQSCCCCSPDAAKKGASNAPVTKHTRRRAEFQGAAVPQHAWPCEAPCGGMITNQNTLMCIRYISPRSTIVPMSSKAAKLDAALSRCLAAGSSTADSIESTELAESTEPAELILGEDDPLDHDALHAAVDAIIDRRFSQWPDNFAMWSISHDENRPVQVITRGILRTFLLLTNADASMIPDSVLENVEACLKFMIAFISRTEYRRFLDWIIEKRLPSTNMGVIWKLKLLEMGMCNAYDSHTQQTIASLFGTMLLFPHIYKLNFRTEIHINFDEQTTDDEAERVINTFVSEIEKIHGFNPSIQFPEWY